VTSTAHAPLEFGADRAGADAICQARAAEASLPGPFVAYLDLTGLPAVDRLGDARGWERVDGEPFADRPVDVAAGAFALPLRLDENGEDLGTDDVPLASGADNGVGAGDCAGYTDVTKMFRIGFVDAAGSSFHAATAQTCAALAHVACFQTSYSEPVAVTPRDGRRAFVSVQSFLPTAGIAPADALCALEAGLAGLSGTFLALLGTTSASAISRFDLEGPTWVRLDGVALADSPLEFAAGASVAPLDMTAAGTRVSTDVVTGGVLPGALPDGDSSCRDWTIQTASNEFPRGRSDRSGPRGFERAPSYACAGPVYCLEK
jgi:hypothetical protein